MAERRVKGIVRSVAAPLATIATVGVVAAGCSTASSGPLDSGFGSGGVATAAFGPSVQGHSLAVHPDGRITVGGSNAYGEAAFARYTTDGDLDTSFGGDGKVTLVAPPASEDYAPIGLADAMALLPQADGKVVAGGLTTVEPAATTVRLRNDGSLDTAYGTAGQGAISPTVPSWVNALANRGTKVVAVGTNDVNGELFGLTADGKRDSGFAGAGYVDYNPTTDPCLCALNAVAVQSADGKIVVAGHVNDQVLVARFNSNGTPDTTFGGANPDGTKGWLTSAAAEDAKGVAIQGDGKIVVAATSDTNTGGFTLLRFHANGSVDRTFDGDGVAAPGFGTAAQVVGVGVGLDGTITAAGSVDGKFAVARFGAGGALDTLRSGTASVGSDAVAGAMALQPDGKVLVAGTTTNSNGYSRFAVARFN